MLNDKLRSVRALALGLAFVATAFYAIVMPWHLAARFAAEVAAAQNLALMGAPCSIALGLANEFDYGLSQGHHAPRARAHREAAEPNPAPNPHFRCPLCKGLAAMQFVLLATALPSLPEPFGDHIAASPSDDLPAELFAPAPQSRGPPFLS